MLNEPDEDWSQNFDDLDGEFWGNYMDRPDEYEIEAYQEHIMEMDMIDSMHEEEREDDFLNCDRRHYEKPDGKGRGMKWIH